MIDMTTGDVPGLVDGPDPDGPPFPGLSAPGGSW
jgi:hypothetical protein